MRYLHNVMGLWLLSESVRQFNDEGKRDLDLPELLAAASALTTPVSVFDANDASFLPPGDMPARIAAWCTTHGLAAPQTPVEFVRSIVESLAVAFADAVRTASELSGKTVSVIHIVGGGSQNELLCQLTADATGLPVVAGPAEGTALGNLLVQARAMGHLTGGLTELRKVARDSSELVTYFPSVDADPEAWGAAERRAYGA